MHFLFYLFIFASTTQATNNTPQPPDDKSFTAQIPTPPVVNNFTINAPINNQNSPVTNVASNAQSQSAAESFMQNETVIAITQEIKNRITSIQKFIADVPGKLQPWQPWFFNNRWRFLASSVALLYIYTWYRITVLSSALAEPDAWYNYKSMTSFEELLQIQQNELAQDVIRAIQHRYAPQAIKDFFTPFLLFTKEIEREIEILQQLITLCKRIRLFRMHFLFPGQHSYFEHAQNKLRRVLYIRNIAFSWLGSFKLEKILQLAPEHLFSPTTKSLRYHLNKIEH